MDANHFDRHVKSFSAIGTRRGVVRVLSALPLTGAVSILLDAESGAAKRRGRKNKRRGDHRGQVKDQGKKKKKKCAKSGQPPKKGKRCCKGLAKSPSGTCAGPAVSPTCATSCPGCCAGETCLAGTNASACGRGGSPCRVCANPTPSCRDQTCAVCTASSQCPSGTVCDGEQCQTCTVTCPGGACDGMEILQPALNDGGTIYACPGRYSGRFTAPVSVTLIGAGDGADPAQNTILDAEAEPNERNVLNTVPGITVQLRGLRLTGGHYVTSGGIDNWNATLTMTNCTVAGNTAGNDGGGINNNGGSTLTMTNCTISGNNAGVDGAGIYNRDSTVTLNGCTVTGNIAGDRGGGIFNGAGSTVTLDASSSASSSVTDNTANGVEPAGGGIFNEGTVTIIDGTVSGNDPDECIDSGGTACGCEDACP